MACRIVDGFSTPTDPPPTLESELRYKAHSMWRYLVRPKQPKVLPERIHRHGLSVFYQFFWRKPVTTYPGHWEIVAGSNLWFRMSWRKAGHHAESFNLGFCLFFIGIIIEWNGPDTPEMLEYFERIKAHQK